MNQKPFENLTEALELYKNGLITTSDLAYFLQKADYELQRRLKDRSWPFDEHIDPPENTDITALFNGA